MCIKKILKIFMINTVLFSLLFTISFMAACGGPATTEEVIEEEAETVEQDEEEADEEEDGEAEAEEEEGVAAEEEEGEAAVENMKIKSTAFGNDEMIPVNYTCDGEDINPPLTISGVPADAKSLVLIVDDPDAPAGTWLHWAVWNIDPAVMEIPENSLPAGAVEGETDFGTPGYRGPCPPSGIHHYFFKLYALDTTLELGVSATVQDIEEAMDGHILESAELVGLCER
jgi:Raf kinase inhibitor-like YbhB/YbcL family protein